MVPYYEDRITLEEIPEGIREHWLYHYDLWCKENGQEPEVIEITDDNLDHVFYHAEIYADKHGFTLDGEEFIYPEGRNK